MRAGLVSITYRKLSPEAIVDLAERCGLRTIEWGGDIHVPHGDIEAARRVARLTYERGLDVCAYGSYYALVESEAKGLSFSKVLETAVALETSRIRVWAGRQGSAIADEDYRGKVIEDALRAADLAHRVGVSICYEFHGGSLTDTAASAGALLKATDHPAVLSLWQPSVGLSAEECLTGLEMVLDRLAHVHAFHWWPDARDRLPLSDGRERWQLYLERIRAAGKDPDVLLEFVPGDDPELLLRESTSLRELLAG